MARTEPSPYCLNPRSIGIQQHAFILREKTVMTMVTDAHDPVLNVWDFRQTRTGFGVLTLFRATRLMLHRPVASSPLADHAPFPTLLPAWRSLNRGFGLL